MQTEIKPQILNDTKVVDGAIHLNIRSTLREPGLMSRKIWQVLYFTTDAGKSGDLDSFLCDLDIFERLLKARIGHWWWEYKKSWTEVTRHPMPNAYRIVIHDDKIIITPPERV